MGLGGRCRRGLEEENSRDQLQEEKEIILEIKTFLKKKGAVVGSHQT